VTRRSALKLAETRRRNTSCDVRAEAAVEAVSAALFAAGAGRIESIPRAASGPGTGTFSVRRGEAHDRSEREVGAVAGIRFETVVAISKISDVIAALRKTHPYEEPAFDLNQLAAAPEGLGIGRVGEFDAGVGRAELFDRIKRAWRSITADRGADQWPGAARRDVCRGVRRTAR